MDKRMYGIIRIPYPHAAAASRLRLPRIWNPSFSQCPFTEFISQTCWFSSIHSIIGIHHVSSPIAASRRDICYDGNGLHFLPDHELKMVTCLGPSVAVIFCPSLNTTHQFQHRHFCHIQLYFFFALPMYQPRTSLLFLLRSCIISP